MLQHQQNQLIQAQHIFARRRRKRRRAVRDIWVRDWIARRPQLGLYDRLMVEDPRAFKRFMRMPPAMYDEIVQRLTPAFIKQTTDWKALLEPGLKVVCRSSGSANVKTSRVRPLYAALQITRDKAVLWQWNDRFTSVINTCSAVLQARCGRN